jgi:lipoate-protein ligase B
MQKQCREDKKWFCVELPVTEYMEAWDLQASLAYARKERIIDRDIALLLEHPSVFTIGRRGSFYDLIVSEDFLKREGIQIVKVERGGNITYHGPGQLIMYLIIDLHIARLGVAEYTSNLEEVMIRAASDFGIRAERNPINRGVWVKNKKLGSVGIAIRRGISFHGFAINVNLNLRPFEWINPCGLKNVDMTSIEQELSRKVSMHKLQKSIKRHTESVFGIRLEAIGLKEYNGILKKAANIDAGNIYFKRPQIDFFHHREHRDHGDV